MPHRPAEKLSEERDGRIKADEDFKKRIRRVYSVERGDCASHKAIKLLHRRRLSFRFKIALIIQLVNI